MTDKIRIGIVGVGYAGKKHLTNMLHDSRVEVHGIYDILWRRMNSIASLYNLKKYSSYEEMTEDSKLDAIYVCTPNVFHTEQTLLALNNSKHVFCEKPMALKLTDATKVAQAVRNKKLKYQIGFNRRFCPAYRYVKKLIESGKIEPTSLNIKIVRNGLEKPPWVKDPSVSGGILYETVVHMLDLSRWLIGEIGEVRCQAEILVYDQLDTFTITLRSPEGKISNIFSNCYTTKMRPFERLELFDKEAELIVEEFQKVLYKHSQLVIKDFTSLREAERWGYAIEDKYFIDSLLNDRDTVVDEGEALQSAILLAGCQKSIAGKTSIRLRFA
ncbi:MAG: Gfo/Idh/MocA family protein [Nitrososphaerales archaeon]